MIQPGFSRCLDKELAWLDGWEQFIQELESNFSSYNDIGEAENELAALKMPTGQHISEYIVCFNSLASCCDWGNAPLQHHFYDGLLNCLKDKVS
jgi:hypothetical protein